MSYRQPEVMAFRAHNLHQNKILAPLDGVTSRFKISPSHQLRRDGMTKSLRIHEQIKYLLSPEMCGFRQLRTVSVVLQMEVILLPLKKKLQSEQVCLRIEKSLWAKRDKLVCSLYSNCHARQQILRNCIWTFLPEGHFSMPGIARIISRHLVLQTDALSTGFHRRDLLIRGRSLTHRAAQWVRWTETATVSEHGYSQKERLQLLFDVPDGTRVPTGVARSFIHQEIAKLAQKPCVSINLRSESIRKIGICAITAAEVELKSRLFSRQYFICSSAAQT